MEEITIKDIKKALKLLKKEWNYKCKHPKDWYGFCQYCGLLKLHPSQAKALREVFKLDEVNKGEKWLIDVINVEL